MSNLLLILAAQWTLMMMAIPSLAHADSIGDEILARDRCMAACDNDTGPFEIDRCAETCPSLSTAAQRRLRHRLSIGGGSSSLRSEACTGVTQAILDTDRIAAEAGFQKVQGFLNRIRTAGPTDKTIEGLNERQVQALRSAIGEAGTLTRNYDRRLSEITAAEGTAAHLLAQRRAVFALEAGLRARIDQIGVPANHALRRKTQKAFTTYRRTSYPYMRHSECSNRLVADAAVSEETVPTVELPIIESSETEAPSTGEAAY